MARLIPAVRSRAATERARVGRLGERAAAAYLRRSGFRVLARNLRLPPAEVDILALDRSGRLLLVVEVKSRRSQGSPLDNLSQEQRGRLRAAAAWISRDRRARGRSVRIDLVTVRLDRANRPVLVRHYPGAIGR